jgi:aminoglycoside phosphotransferase (APT) family kinase protein
MTDEKATSHGVRGRGDPDQIRMTSTLEGWLEGQLPGTGPVTLGPLNKPGAGLSAGTFLFEAHRDEGAHDLVVRIPPPAEQSLFPWTDLARELEIQTLLANAGVPVPPVVALETDSSVLGRPFLVTRRVKGRLVDSNDPYMSSGWLHDSDPEFQLRLARSFMTVLADIHRLPAGEIENTGQLPVDQIGNEGTLSRWSGYLAWADESRAPDALHEALRWCVENRPADEPPPTLLWGDAQLANAVFADDGSTAAVLDFELASAGPAELDLGWFFCLHDLTVARCGEDLPGFTDRAGLIATYEERVGRQVADLGWYAVFAAVCTASILVRMASLLCSRGVDADWLARSNPALDYLSQARLT